MTHELFEVLGVRHEYALPRTAMWQPRRTMTALDDVSLEVRESETLGIVGESGSGKSTLTRLLLALEQPTAGRILYRGNAVSGLPARRLRALRREVQVVFQDPGTSLDPRMKVARAVAEPLRALRIPGDHVARVQELFELVGLPSDAGDRYPHEFSGGQAQRIAIARALAPGPRVLIADEPVSALDVSIQAQVLNLLLELNQELGLTVVLISHDLAIVHHITDRVLVMQKGRIVEAGPTPKVFDDPQHPYTRSLLAAIPTLDAELAPPAVRESDGRR